MEKTADTRFPIHQLIQRRWSPYAFSKESLKREDLLSLLEAARWASSAMNEQPWRYIVALREDKEDFARLLACIVEGNQVWAKDAAALLLAVGATRYARNDKENPHAWYDVGQANAQLALEAAARGLFVHPMGGFDGDKARDTLAIPEGFEPVCALAVGHPGDVEELPEGLKERELSLRSRREVADFAFAGRWESPLVRSSD
ncbi:MAG: nitroreductase family protein [Deltaproteobacteria bacterium]|nr:nitroreductase family protein [Deltaproteobacteria bacterium]